MDCVALDVGVWDISVHVEVHAVTTHNLGLAAVSEFSVGDVGDHALSSSSHHHEVRTIFLLHRCLISHHFDVPGQQPDFGSDFQVGCSKGFGLSDMFVCKG